MIEYAWEGLSLRKRVQMFIKNTEDTDELRALLNFRQSGLVEYSADPYVERRVGKFLSDTVTPLLITQSGAWAKRE